jgi:hypothetical protein
VAHTTDNANLNMALIGLPDFLALVRARVQASVKSWRRLMVMALRPSVFSSLEVKIIFTFGGCQMASEDNLHYHCADMR